MIMKVNMAAPLTAIFEKELIRKYGLFFSHVTRPE